MPAPMSVSHTPMSHATFASFETSRFHVKGANWFGSEAFNGPPGGLDHHSIRWYMALMLVLTRAGLK